ncbi:MAG TPA: integrase [Rhodospirillaceae bacterium]|nr:integrase [Rhodospirillaceae bacterium]|tara:strand:+ start:2026 stop:3285 length:1260 start_codon:yes stop_codon:yes gene_type:complete
MASAAKYPTRIKLTKPLVKGVVIDEIEGVTPSTKDKVLWDTEVTGFGLRVTRNGAKAYIFKYRLGHGRAAKTTKMRIAGIDLSLDKARQKARQHREQVADGEDPSRKRDENANAPTMSQLCEDYMERHAPKKRTKDEDQRIIDNVVKPKIGRLKVADVKFRDVEDLHRDLRKTPYQANRVLALVKTMFNLAIKWEWRETNPAKGVERFPEERREVFLSPKQIEELSQALAAYEANATRKTEARKSANAIRLLMLTGSRRNEVLSARWEQFDLDAGVWIKPSAHTKQKKEHRVPLAPAAKELLVAIREDGEHPTGYVFPSRTGEGHLGDLKRAWADVCALAKIKGVRIHDLRHTYASILASGGMSLPIIGALLGHTQPATTARYTHLYDDPLRAATERVAAVYGRRKDEGGEVVEIKGGV